MLKLVTLFLTLFLCSSMVFSADTNTSEGETTSTAAASQSDSSNHDVATATEKPTGFPRYSLGELSFLPSGVLGHVITGGAVAVGVIVILLVASLFYPFASFKGLCSLTDSCPTSNYRVDTYPTPGALSANTNGNTYSDSTYNSPYSQPGAYSPTYQKRSLEYVGPILKMLNAAYEKYGKPAHHSNAISNSERSKEKDRRRRR